MAPASGWVSTQSSTETLKWSIQPKGLGTLFELDGSGNIDQYRYITTYSGGGTRRSRITFKKPLVVKFDPSDDATADISNIMNRNIFCILRRKYLSLTIDYDISVQINYTDV